MKNKIRKVLVNRKPVSGPWGGGNLFLSSMCELMPDMGFEITHKLADDIDIFFIMNPRYDELKISINEAIAYKRKFPDVKIVQRINDCDARKNTSDVDDMLVECSKYLDKTIFVSEWMKTYFMKKGWHCKENLVLINGCHSYKKKEKNNNAKINIVTHHWSNNYLKGFDIYDKLDEWVENKKFTFTYIGRDRGTFKNTNVIAPLHGKDLHHELSKYDVYISGSRFDPGPNHILESLSCNLPTYVHSEGGGCVEFAGEDMTFDSFESLIKILNSKNYKNNNSINVKTWKECIDRLGEII